MHQNDRAGLDPRQHDGRDLLRIRIEGIDRIYIPLDRDQACRMHEVEGRPVVAPAREPKVAWRDAGHPLDRLLGEADLLCLRGSADPAQAVTRRVTGWMRVTVVADLEVRIRGEQARARRVRLAPRPGRVEGR